MDHPARELWDHPEWEMPGEDVDPQSPRRRGCPRENALPPRDTWGVQERTLARHCWEWASPVPSEPLVLLEGERQPPRPDLFLEAE